jgi:RNA polymerase-binding transcription factor DksA
LLVDPDMRREFMERVEKSLRRRRDELAAYCEAITSSELEILEQREPDLLDVSADHALAHQIDEIGERERTELEAIDAALARIARGTFGRCHSCGEPIEESRLEVSPWTPSCLGCARALEETRGRAASTPRAQRVR